MNICLFMGRLTKDLELRYYGEENKAVANFCLAVSEGYGEHQRTDFLNFVAYGKTAETIERYVKKGQRVLITSRAKNNEYTNKEGQKIKRDIYEVQKFELIEPKKQSSDDGFMSVDNDVDSESLPFN